MKLIALAFVMLIAIGSMSAAPAQQPAAIPPTPQGLAADIQPTKSRMQKLDIDYKPDERKNIARIELVFSRDQGQTWEVMDAVTPDKDHLVFNAKDDGLYYLNMVIVFRNGTRDPQDVPRAPAALKLLVDSVAPVVRITNVQRSGEEVVVDWVVEEKYLNDSATQVLYKASSNTANEWIPVPTSSIGKRSARFKPTLTGPILVRVMAYDYAGNLGDVAREAPVAVTASYTPNQPPPVLPTTAPPGASAPRPNTALESPTAPAPAPLSPALPAAPGGLVMPTNPVTIPNDPAGATPAPPAMPTTVSPTTTPSFAPVPAPSTVAPTNTQPNWAPMHVSGGQPIAPTGMHSAPAPAPLPTNPMNAGAAGEHGFQPIATGSGINPMPAAAAANSQLINYTQFDLKYQLDNGPSGISKIDLYVTRDEGRTWMRWSQHTSTESPLRVMLDSSFNQRNMQVEGDYGFKIVPTSGAGLSDGAPQPGTPPELRVHVDLTPPLVEVGAPEPDPAQRNAMVLRWRVSDRNIGKEPVLIEWSEQPTGPWTSVAASESATTLVAGPIPNATAMRVPNTGSYTWVLPTTMRTHKVFLRFSAWDAAGNKTEATNPQPFLVDPHKPKARIQGIMNAAVSPRP